MLELKNIKKSYDGVTVLKNIDLTISDGEIVSILGPSGCGKTTLLNLILGLTDADSGKIIFDGKDITNVPMEKRGFNIVFQDYALFPNLNVMQNITYGLKNMNKSRLSANVIQLGPWVGQFALPTVPNHSGSYSGSLLLWGCFL